MKLSHLQLKNYKGFDDTSLAFHQKNTVIFGVNGQGKSSVLSAICQLCYPWIASLNPTQGTKYQAISKEMVKNGKRQLSLSAVFQIEGDDFPLALSYQRKTEETLWDSATYEAFIAHFSKNYLDESGNMPLFANYGTNRSVTTFQVAVDPNFTTQKLHALDNCLDNELNYTMFFEWYCNMEHREQQQKKATKNDSHQDKTLSCVRYAIEQMLGEVKDLQIKHKPLRMVVTKGENELRVDQLSDGEKCVLALFSDIARRLALANPSLENPLEGTGLVLIDEIELHMHPLWQRKIMTTLKTVFPNLQFIVSTHSPQVLSELDDSFTIYKLDMDENGLNTAIDIDRMDGFDVAHILEEYMGTTSKNPIYQALLDSAYDAIDENEFALAQNILERIADITSENSSDYIALHGTWKRRKFLHDRNQKG